MKKLAGIFLAMVMCLTICVPAFAVNEGLPGQDNKNSVTLNEFEVLKELADQPTVALMEDGYSSQDISAIRNYREVYSEHIQSLNQLTDIALQRHGYSQDQIVGIRNFGGTEAEMSALSASVRVGSSVSNFSYDGNYSRGRVSYNWQWSGVPAFLAKDIFAVSWNNWVVESNSGSVVYYAVTSGQRYSERSATFSTDGNGTLGASHKFDLGLSDSYYYAKTGTGYFNIRSDVHSKKDLFYYMEYGHSRITVSVSFYVGIGGADGSINFSSGIVKQGSDSGSYTF